MKLRYHLRDYVNKKRIDKVCKKVSTEYNIKISWFNDIFKLGRGSYGYIPGYGDRNHFERSNDFTIIDENNNIIADGIAPYQRGLDRYNGGTIVFSSKNEGEFDKYRFKNNFNQIYNSVINKLRENKKIIQIIKQKLPKLKDIGFSSGNFFKGKYIDVAGNEYTEKSTSIEILGVSSEVLVRLATEIAREIKQGAVLLKDYNTGKNILIDRT